MESWTPIHRQILDSSLWEAKASIKVVWITILLIASEPGRNGEVDMTVRSLAARAGESVKAVQDAITFLMAPDPKSRTRAHEGRRLLPIDPERGWGWEVANWNAYILMRETAYNATRQRRYKKRKKARENPASGAAPDGATVTGRQPKLPRDVEREKDKEKEKEKRERASLSGLSEMEKEIAERGYLFTAKTFVKWHEKHGLPLGDWRAGMAVWSEREKGSLPIAPLPLPDMPWRELNPPEDIRLIGEHLADRESPPSQDECERWSKWYEKAKSKG